MDKPMASNASTSAPVPEDLVDCGGWSRVGSGSGCSAGAEGKVMDVDSLIMKCQMIFLVAVLLHCTSR
jgi:hypothetical protein